MQTKRRIELAAAKRDTPVTQYCLDAIVQQMADDELLEVDAVEIDVNPKVDTGLIEDMWSLREEILSRRGNIPISMDFVGQVRAERDDELICLH
jgi:hypothetical protein